MTDILTHRGYVGALRRKEALEAMNPDPGSFEGRDLVRWTAAVRAYEQKQANKPSDNREKQP